MISERVLGIGEYHELFIDIDDTLICGNDINSKILKVIENAQKGRVHLLTSDGLNNQLSTISGQIQGIKDISRIDILENKTIKKQNVDLLTTEEINLRKMILPNILLGELERIENLVVQSIDDQMDKSHKAKLKNFFGYLFDKYRYMKNSPTENLGIMKGPLLEVKKILDEIKENDKKNSMLNAIIAGVRKADNELRLALPEDKGQFKYENTMPNVFTGKDIHPNTLTKAAFINMYLNEKYSNEKKKTDKPIKVVMIDDARLLNKTDETHLPAIEMASMGVKGIQENRKGPVVAAGFQTKCTEEDEKIVIGVNEFLKGKNIVKQWLKVQDEVNRSSYLCPVEPTPQPSNRNGGS